MFFLRFTLPTLILALLTYPCSAQTISASKPEEITSAFFAKYKTQGVDEALSYLFTNTDDTSLTRQIDELRETINSTVPKLGDYYGYELITQKSIANCLVMYSYLIKHKVQPARVTFIFYKPITGWQLQKFGFDANEMEDELEEAGRLYFISK